MTVPQPVIDAMDRLNSHARSPGLGVMSSERHAIYAYKAAVVTVLAHAGEVKGRLVSLQVKCRSCGGTGKWIDYEARIYSPIAVLDHTEPCRTCSHTGKVTLRFLETTLPGDKVWHHPWSTRFDCVGLSLAQEIWPGMKAAAEGDGYRALTGDELRWEAPGDWLPNTPSQALPQAEFVDLANVVEDWLAPGAWLGKSMWRLDVARRKAGEYDLHLGRVDGDCCICGSPYVACRLGCSVGRLRWSAPICDRHLGFSSRERPTEVPSSLITPAVERWLANPLRQKPRERQEW